MNDTTTTGAALRLIEFCASTPPIPQSIIDRAKVCLLDALGCGLFGSQQDAGRIMSHNVLADRSQGECTLFGSDVTVAPAQAALANGTTVHAFEIDDLLSAAMIHPGTVIVPAALAAAEHVDASAETLLRGIVIGYEAIARLGLALGTEPSHRGFHKTSVAGPVAAAIAAGAVMGLSRDALVSAVGLACSTASGIKSYAGGSGGAMVKGIHGGRSAESGVRMAMLAQDGFNAPRAAIDGRYGLLEVFSGKSAQPAQLWSGLGERWAIDETWIKVFPVCGWIQGLMQLVLDLRGPVPIPLDRVRKVTVGTSAFAVKNNANPLPADSGEAQYSIPYCAAVALESDPKDPAQFERAAFTDAARLAFAQRVEVTVDDASEAVFPRQFGTKVRIRLDDGEVREASTYDPHGTPADPCTYREVVDKLTRLAAFAPVGDAAAIVRLVENIDASTRTRALSSLLRARRS
ncbi:MAG TPA: MmgE/PrpD family protein [Burkholderiales bacterium]|nr:MmgE/PrpD family protein [Burkholderiales bacterium]